MTWIEVADSAVKIGLGALLGGVFGLMIAWVNNRSQSLKGYYERRRTLLEHILESVDSASNSAATYWANLMNGVYKRDTNQRLSDDELSSLQGLERQFFAAFSSLNSSAAKLLLLGEEQAEASLAELRLAFENFFKVANIDGDKCTKVLLEEHKMAMSKARRAFFQSLSEAYKRQS